MAGTGVEHKELYKVALDVVASYLRIPE